MRFLSRFVFAIALGTAALAVVAVGVPLAIRQIYRHGSSTEAAKLAPLTTVREQGSTVYAANGAVLAVLRSSVTRVPVKLRAVPKILIHAVLDTEDQRFYQHGGIDVPSTLRALLADSSGAGLQGGSTITQQLVKQVYLTSQRTLSRKLKEAVIADRLQRIYTKNEILDAYLNTVYLGSGAYGVDAASEAYWGEKVGKVTLAQAALLAGLIQNPSGYDPISNPSGARFRRGEVLARMVHYHTISPAQAARANAAPLPTVAATPPTELHGVDGYYVSQVEQQLLGPGSPLGSTPSERYAALFEGGLRIYTNLNPALQADAVTAVATDTPANTAGYEEALVSIDPATGAVVAMVPGKNFAKEQFDVVTQGLRQPGSGFKIFTILPALASGDNIFDPVDGTSPCAIPFPGNDSLLAHPAHNDEGDGRSGPTTIQEATALSLNCAYLRMGHQVGLAKVVATAERLGVPASELRPFAHDPSMIIGSASVSPLQMSAAYAALAGGGVYRRPQFVNRVVDRTGTTIYTEPTGGRRIASPLVVEEADTAFQAVVKSGTGTAAQIPGREVAGKTGTNNGPTDAWFNGFTPQLEATVWMGDPASDSRQLIVGGQQVYGGTYPARTVHDYLAAALTGRPVVDFPAIDYAALPPTRIVPEVTGPFPGSPALVTPSPPTTAAATGYPTATVPPTYLPPPATVPPGTAAGGTTGSPATGPPATGPG